MLPSVFSILLRGIISITYIIPLCNLLKLGFMSSFFHYALIKLVFFVGLHFFWVMWLEPWVYSLLCFLSLLHSLLCTAVLILCANILNDIFFFFLLYSSSPYVFSCVLIPNSILCDDSIVHVSISVCASRPYIPYFLLVSWFFNIQFHTKKQF